jgi:hypothetical protein
MLIPKNAKESDNVSVNVVIGLNRGRLPIEKHCS